jgi:hypothetical protein
MHRLLAIDMTGHIIARLCKGWGNKLSTIIHPYQTWNEPCFEAHRQQCGITWPPLITSVFENKHILHNFTGLVITDDATARRAVPSAMH